MWNSEAQLTVTWHSTAVLELFIGFVGLEKPLCVYHMILPGKEPIIFVPCHTSFFLTILFMKSVFISALNKSAHSIRLNSILNNGILPYYTVHSESNYLWASDVIKLRVSQTDS